MKEPFKSIGKIIKLLIILLLSVSAYAQYPEVKIDFNFDGRQESEVHDPDYSSWIISAGQTDSFQESNIRFILRSGGFGSSWYKAGTQTPNFARLISDGLVSSDVEILIVGLATGEHTFLTYHNSFSNPENTTFTTIDIFVNGELIHDDLQQSNRALRTEDAVSAFLTFEAVEGDTTVLRFKADQETDANDKFAYINGFELNTPDATKQARSPYPGGSDRHADADNGSVELKWAPAQDALSHDVYFGTDEDALLTADRSSAEFLGNQTDTRKQVVADQLITYYWRVDEISATDTTRGDLWYFIPRRDAFNGAEGYGRYAIGGRGGKVVYVTNLDDSGPGSLREAVENSIGPRTIVFKVSGLITLKSRLTLKDDFVTVAGQTAPGKGICIRQAPFGLSGAEDCIVQNMRVRLGSGPTFDGMGMSGSDHCIIDHCSISWTIDESFSSRGGHNITLQRTLISEALNAAGHQNYPDGSKHGYAASISGDVGSFHHNLLAHCYGRNWSLAGGLDGNGVYAGRLDISNNVVYNFGPRTTDGGAHEVNFIGNYYKPGPGHTGNNYALNAQNDGFPGTQRYYFVGNVMEGIFDENNQSAGRRESGETRSYSAWVDEPFFPSEITMHSAKEAYKNVLSDVGCVQPVFDDHDQRIIDETLNGTYTYRGSRTGIKGMPDSHEDVGGWEEYPELERVDDWDSDMDGLPNWWEDLHGLSNNSTDFSDANSDLDEDSFTNLEEYLAWMNAPHYLFPTDSFYTIDLSQYARGYTTNPSFEIVSEDNCATEILTSGNEVKVSGVSKGLGKLTFKVTDAEGSNMSRTINMLVGVEISGTKMIGGEEEEEEETLSLMDEEFHIYPNPANHLISFPNSNGFKSASVIDISGNEMLSQNLSGMDMEMLDVSALSAGIYILKLYSENGSESHRFEKQ
ncbi:MAG: T9SS type A sorting domain-containing protein [Cyclobacteriaceae bacterium]